MPQEDIYVTISKNLKYLLSTIYNYDKIRKLIFFSSIRISHEKKNVVVFPIIKKDTRILGILYILTTQSIN